jgi:hypothetical protein
MCLPAGGGVLHEAYGQVPRWQDGRFRFHRQVATMIIIKVFFYIFTNKIKNLNI